MSELETEVPVRRRRRAYESRDRVYLRLKPAEKRSLRKVAKGLRLSINQFCELVLVIAIENQDDWLLERVGERFKESLKKADRA